MPTFAPITLVDRASTPVSHVFTPTSITPSGVGTGVEVTGVPVGQPVHTLGIMKRANGNYVVERRMTIPVVQTQTINGIDTPVVVRVARYKGQFEFEPTSLEAERNNIVGMVQDGYKPTQTIINDVIVKLLGLY